jgi:hypothetical protein
VNRFEFEEASEKNVFAGFLIYFIMKGYLSKKNNVIYCVGVKMVYLL